MLTERAGVGIKGISTALERSRVVALIGPPQCGKTTLAEEFPSPDSESYPTRA